mmetsp:Transcript_9173/g.16557  ORF Transcript_9173/g.16557 Transcript_9173/m.16557 type:complete len:240 (+) Transcript_9173:58-777(+)
MASDGGPKLLDGYCVLEQGFETPGLAEHLLAGGSIAYPTDTVWGLGCHAHNAAAVKECLGKKGEGRQGVASVVCADIAAITKEFCSIPAEVTDKVTKIMEEMLPGPYTFVLPLKDDGLGHLAGEGPTLGVRIPKCDGLLQFVRGSFGRRTLVTTSLNLHGDPPCKEFELAKVVAQKMQIPIVAEDPSESASKTAKVDAPATSASASTVLRWEVEVAKFKVLRQGSGAVEMLVSQDLLVQ